MVSNNEKQLSVIIKKNALVTGREMVVLNRRRDFIDAAELQLAQHPAQDEGLHRKDALKKAIGEILHRREHRDASDAGDFGPPTIMEGRAAKYSGEQTLLDCIRSNAALTKKFGLETLGVAE